MSTPEPAERLVVKDGLNSVKEHPEWYFRSGQFTNTEVVSLLVEEALSNGAPDISARREGGFWILQSSHDWLEGDLAAFFSLVPDPVRGPNTSRVEVLLTAFCDVVWTAWPGETYTVSGETWKSDELAQLLAPPEEGRIVGFSSGEVRRQVVNQESPVRAGPILRLIQGDDLSGLYDDAIEGFAAKVRVINSERGGPW